PAARVRPRRADPGAQDHARHRPVADRGDGSGPRHRRQGNGRVRGVRDGGACGDDRPLQLAADRRGRGQDDRRAGQGAERGLRGSGRRGRRALLSLEGLAARAFAAGPRPEGAAPAARGREGREVGDGAGPRRAAAPAPPVRKVVAPAKAGAPFYLSAASTARFAITVTRCARYSGEACRSLFSPSAFTLMPATASGANFAPSAFSMSAWRNAHGPAPVTPTRTLPPPKSATNTPTMA